MEQAVLLYRQGKYQECIDAVETTQSRELKYYSRAEAPGRILPSEKTQAGISGADDAEIGWSHFQTAVDNRAESHGEGRAFGDERRDDASG